MKKGILIILIVSFIPYLSFAQKMENIASYNTDQHNYTHSSISISDGVLTNREISDALRSGDNIDNVKLSRTENFFLTYRYFFDPQFSLGVAVGMQQVSYEYIDHYNGGGYTYAQKVSTLSFEFRDMYEQEGIFESYFLVCLGFAYSEETDQVLSGSRMPSSATPPVRGWGLNYQLTPVGIRIGRRFGGFLELGLGYKGVINGGLSYRF